MILFFRIDLQTYDINSTKTFNSYDECPTCFSKLYFERNHHDCSSNGETDTFIKVIVDVDKYNTITHSKYNDAIRYAITTYKTNIRFTDIKEILS